MLSAINLLGILLFYQKWPHHTQVPNEDARIDVHLLIFSVLGIFMVTLFRVFAAFSWGDFLTDARVKSFLAPTYS